MIRALIFLFIAVAAVTGEDSAGEVQHRLPAVASVFPQGSQPGARTRVEVLGQYFDRADRIVFLDPSVTAHIVEAQPTRLVAEFSAATAARLGPHYFRVISPRGASNAGLFRLGSQPHRNEREPNSGMDGAETVPVPVTINGQLAVDDDYDFFRFRAAAGETLVFDLRAARNGSSLDAALILLDSRGRKLEHDEDTFIWDPFFAHRFDEAGDYFAVVQPTHTHNDPGFAYQLDIRRDAHIETLSPLALPPGGESEVTLFGQGFVNPAAQFAFEDNGLSVRLVSANGTTAVARIQVAKGVAAGPHRFTLAGSNAGTLIVDPAPVHRGPGPIAAFPVSITGTARYREPEQFPLQVQAGQALTFEVRAQRFGSPVDSVLRILDEKGKVVAANDDGKFEGTVFNKDSRIEHRFAEAGSYRLEIRNLWATTGENFPYQISIRPPDPHVSLMFDSDHPYVFAGQTAKLKVSAARIDGFDREIPLEITGLPAGVTAKPAVIPSGSTELEVELDATLATPGASGIVEIRSPAAPHPAGRAIQVSSGGGEGRHYGEVEGALLTVVERPLFSLECVATSLNLVRGGNATLKVAIARQRGFEEKLTFLAENLPPGVTMELVEDGTRESTVRFRADRDAPAGRAARVSIWGTGGGQKQAAPKIALVVD